MLGIIGIVNFKYADPTSLYELRRAGLPYEALAKYGAEEGTRTPIPFTGLEPESSVSTNFTTSALLESILHAFLRGS